MDQSEKEWLLASITDQERKTIKAGNPFKVERNALIQNLYKRGVSLPLLVELTGMPKSTVHRIATDGFVYAKREREGRTDLRGVKRAIEDLWEEILKLLGNEKK